MKKRHIEPPTPNIWQLNNICLSNLWEEEITGGIRKYLKLNDSEATTHHNEWDASRAVPRGKFIALYKLYSFFSDIALNVYIKKEESSHVI